MAKHCQQLPFQIFLVLKIFQSEEVFSNLINAGSYILEEDVFDIMPKEKHSLERDVFPILAEEGSLAGFPFEGYFIDAGTPTSWHDGVRRCIEEKRFKTITCEYRIPELFVDYI